MAWDHRYRRLNKGEIILPINDLREHDESRNCWCKPVIHAEGEHRCQVMQR